MKVPLSWLREYVRTLPPADRLADVLTNAGVEVEAVIDRRNDFAKVVVGEVVDLKPHPNADKLRLAYVRITPNGQPQEIVCGAPNIEVGQKVAVALLGAKLPNGLTIEARKIRGIASNGMVCAEDELGLGHDHSGIMILDHNLNIGTPFSQAMGFDEIVLDLAVPSNRSDLHSVRGVAREVAAILGTSWKDRPVKFKATTTSDSPVSVKISAAALCRRYTARVIRGVTMKSSPEWLQRRLRGAGMRPINAVVDATNFIMLAYGQPLHAFDASLVTGTIVVRPAKTGEVMTTLDGVKRKLDPSMLVIADVNGPIALAGVMGAATSEIDSATTDIILESAIFDPVSVRRTSRKLGLQSEASRRFEKGLPVGLPDEASQAAAALIVELCGGQIEKLSAVAGSAVVKPVSVKLNPAMFSSVIGRMVVPAKAKSVLTRLGFVVKGTAKLWKVSVPAWRLDVTIPEDVVEEVGRMIGYADLPEALPVMNVQPHPVPELLTLKDEMRDHLVAFGLTEVLSHAFYGSGSVRVLPAGEHIEVANPLDASQQYLRRSLLPQLEMKLELSVDRGEDARIFEIGRVFLSTKSPIEHHQPWRLAIGCALKADRGFVRGRTVRGLVEELYQALGVPFDSVDIKVRESKGRVIEMVELEVAQLRDRRVKRSFASLPVYPAAIRDLAVWVPVGMTYADLAKAIIQAGGELLEQVELFDVFDRDQRRSLAFRLTLRSSRQTLTDAQISATMTVITEALKRLGAELR